MVLSLVLAFLSLSCPPARADAVDGPDFDGIRLEPAWFARDGGWCEPGRWFRGGPCADDWPGQGPGVPSAPDPYRDPNHRDPRWDPRPRPRPHPPLPDSAFPPWWDWSAAPKAADGLASAAGAVYAAAKAARRPGDEKEDLALRDLYQCGQTALWYQGALTHDFRADPWLTQQAYADTVAVYRAALAGLASVKVPPETRAAFEASRTPIEALQRYYDFRPAP